MLSQMAQKIAYFFMSKGLIQKEDAEVYSYGFELLIADSINWLICISIAIGTGRIPETIVYMVAFMHLRETIGGVHANSQWGCLIISTIVYLLFLLGIFVTPEKVWIPLIVIGVPLHMGLVYLIAPVAHPNKPFGSQHEVEVFRKRSLRNSWIYSGVCFLLVLLPWKQFQLFSYCILWGMLTASVSMMIEYVVQIQSPNERGENK